MNTDHKSLTKFHRKRRGTFPFTSCTKSKKLTMQINFEVTRREILHIPKVSKEWGCQGMRWLIVIETCLSYRLAGDFYSPSLLEFLLSITPLTPFSHCDRCSGNFENCSKRKCCHACRVLSRVFEGWKLPFQNAQLSLKNIVIITVCKKLYRKNHPDATRSAHMK